MWLLFNDASLSIVRKPDQEFGTLTVRARVAGDIERVCGPDVSVTEGGGTDYPFRAIVPVSAIQYAMVQRLAELDYDNFKASVPEPDRHAAYSRIWRRLHDFGEARSCHGTPMPADA